MVASNRNHHGYSVVGEGPPLFSHVCSAVVQGQRRMYVPLLAAGQDDADRVEVTHVISGPEHFLACAVPPGSALPCHSDP